MSTSLFAGLALAVLTAAPPNNSPVREELVVVFRYHPGLLAPNREARRQDDRQILKTIHDLEIGYSSVGGLGSGYEMRLLKKDLGRWKEAIDKLIDDGALQVYRWGTDMDGYGLIRLK
jgi:hypothetical protein